MRRADSSRKRAEQRGKAISACCAKSKEPGSHSSEVFRMNSMSARVTSDIRSLGPWILHFVNGHSQRLLLVFIVLVGFGAVDISLKARAQDGPNNDAPVFNVAATSVVRGIAFTPDGKSLISAGYDKVVRI